MSAGDVEPATTVVVCTGHRASWSARTRAKRGDVVLDLEALSDALGGDTDRDQWPPDHLRYVALGALAGAQERAVRLRETCTVWLVHAEPTPDQLAAYESRGYTVLPPATDDVATVESARLGRERQAVSEAQRQRRLMEAIGRYDDELAGPA